MENLFSMFLLSMLQAFSVDRDIFSTFNQKKKKTLAILVFLIVFF